MGISETLGNAYMKVEDAYYGVLDFFEEKGVGLPWTYNDFLETKGMPALPFTIALLALVVSGMFYVSTSNTPQDIAFSLALKDDKGRALEDVSVKITDSKGKTLFEGIASDGQTITLKSVSPTEKLTITARKQGFGERTGTLFVGEKNARIIFQGSNDAIVGKLKLVDGETGTIVTNAIVTAEWQGATVPLTASPGSDGIVSLNVPLNEEVSLVVRADNYEDLVDNVTFTSGDVKIKELTPKASASTGKSLLLVKAIDKTTQLPLENVHIKIENAQTNETISDIDVTSGVHSENLTKGLVVRVSVSKKDYTTYTSNTEYPGGKTLRNEEEIILAPLSFGETTLNVITQSESSKQPLSNVELTLLDSQLEKIADQTSNFSGEAEFSGLNETNEYTLLAYSANFFPQRKKVDWTTLPSSESGRTLLLPLTPFVSGNAGTLTVFVSEKDGKAATQTSVSVFEKVNEEYVPLVASRNVDSVGSFTARLPVGMSILVRAERNDTLAEEELVIVSGLNKVLLTLDEDARGFTLNLKTSDGKPFVGNVIVKTASGNELFSGAVTNGEVDFLAAAGETVTIVATDTEGGKFSKTITLGNENEITITFDSTSNEGNAPQLTYEGLFDVRGKSVPGVSSSEDVFARFTVKWPSNMSKGGLFVRVGNDEVSSVDSQFVGVVGLNGDVDSVAYGRSWNPTPKPGKETKDRSMNGKAGAFNKWMEAIVERPLGTQTFDIRMRAREGVQEGSIDIFYRAFVQTTTQTIRTPNDSELGNVSFNAAKSGLYAASLSTSVSVYENLPFCQGKICVTLNIVDADNRSFNVGNVQTLAGKMYAIQMNVQTAKTNANSTTTSGEGLVPAGSVNSGTGTGNNTTTSAGNATVKVNTDNENPLLVFTKFETGTFNTLKDTGSKDTGLTFSLGGTTSLSGANARVHFLPENVGDSTITLQIISGNESFTQTIPIEIVQAKLLSVDLPERVENGDAISIRVLDASEQTPITSALITFTDASGKFSGSVKGTNTANKGESGLYVMNKSLEAGLYNVRVSVPGYADYESGLSVGINSPLKLDEKIIIAIPFGQTKTTQNVNVTNTTKHAISLLTGELETIGNFPEEFSIDVGNIPLLASNGKATIPITVTYTGDPASEETKTGNATFNISGTAALAFPVKGSVPLTITYNPKLDAKCLQFSKEKLSVTLMSETQPYGNMYNGSTLNTNTNYYGNAQPLNYNAYNSEGFNSFGFNANGNYQNAETKRVNVKVKNNCGETLNLVPGITQNEGQPFVDGLKIAAIDSSLKLTTGQEKQVDFEVSNSMFRAGLSTNGMQFYATFSSAQLTASLPFDVTFWDRSMAIQTPENVELTLIKTGNQKAVDRVNVPLTNIGSSPIYGITAALEGETVSDVTLKLENVPGKISGNQAVLLPGQTLYPPLAIVGESLRDESSLVNKKMVISGIVEGRKVILREINVFARTGGSSCLEVSAFDTPVSFISSETQGSISKRITVQNKCLEPVRITRVESSKIGTNTLNVSAIDGSDIIEMNDEKEFNLVLTKAQPFKNQFTITLAGVMVLSQKTISSNTLPLVIALGSQELEFSQASNPVQVDVCEGGSITVRYPIVAKKDECSQAYCDAEQAGHMISDAIEKQLAKAVQQMQSKKNDASQFSACDIGKQYCTFSQLGIASPSLTLYLQNDTLTPNMLSYVMKSGAYPRLGGLLVTSEPSLKGDAGDSVFASRLGTGFGNAVYLPTIEGCGVYELSILGGVEVVTNQIQSDKVSIGIKLTKDRVKTAECQDKIYNAANFLPKNRSLSIENAQQTRLGVVEYEKVSLEEAAGWLAETVFGKSSRAVKNSSSNRMTLNIGNLAESIVELTLDPNTKGEGSKNIITVVRQTQGSVQKESMIEAGKIITNLGRNVKGCITRDEQTWRIKSIPDVGQFTYEGCPLSTASEGGLIVRSTLTCCTLSTKSDVSSDAAYTLTPSGIEPIVGLSQIDLYEVKVPVSSTNTYAKPGEKISYDAAYPLVFDTKKQVYGKDVLLCGVTDPRIQQQANKQTVQTFATRTLDETKAGPLKLELRTCTLDADDALAKANNKGKGTWYATLDWEGDDARKTILQTIAEATQNDKLGNAYVSYLGQGILANDNPVYQEKLAEKKSKALVEYGAACLVACGACEVAAGFVMGGVTWGTGSLECALSCGVGTGVGFYENYKENADGVPVAETARDVLGENIYGTYRDTVIGVVPGSGENQEGASALVAGTTTAAIVGGKNFVKATKDKVDALPTVVDVSFAPAQVAELDAAKKALTVFNEKATNLKTLGLKSGEKKLLEQAITNEIYTSKGLSGTVKIKSIVSTNSRFRITYSDAFGHLKDTVRTPNFFASNGVTIPNLSSMKAFTAQETDALVAEVQKAKKAAQEMATKYKALNRTELKQVVDDLEKTVTNLDNFEKKAVSAIRKSTGAAKLTAINTKAFDDSVKVITDSVKSGDEIAKKMAPGLGRRTVQTLKENKTKLKGLARGLICGGAGNAAGYSFYRGELSNEVENKITLEAGSKNIIDTQTNEMIFEKGQTYKFTISTGEGKGNSHTITVDVVSPETQVNPAAWLDDCSNATN